MIDENTFEKISRRIDTYRDDMIELQKALTAVPAVGPVNGGDGEMLKAQTAEKASYRNGFYLFSSL